MLKNGVEVRKALKRLYDRVWAEEAAGCSEKTWPQQVALGKCSKPELEARFVEICALSDNLCGLASSLGLTVASETRLVGGTKQSVPTHFVIESMDALARAVSEGRNYGRAQERACRLNQNFPGAEDAEIARLLRKMEQVVPDETDFDLACRAGAWFRRNDARGLTARQVPLVGFHAKWLDAPGRRFVVAWLAGLDELPLEQRPPQVRFTYLDPEYLAGGGRRFDSWVVGDVCNLPYDPQIVVICENRDSSLWFPDVASGIAVMGDGFAAIQNISTLTWVRNAPLVVYWGDMDSAGLEILSGCRQRGIDCESMLMDVPAFEKYSEFGTSTDKNGHAIQAKAPDDLPGLREHERELYLRLVDPDWQGVRRIEQERIPLEDALTELTKMQRCV
jgi:hypothetical protein